MPSTSSLPSLTIGFRRAEMTAFWILTSAPRRSSLGLAAMLRLARARRGSGQPPVSCLPLPGLVWPIWFEFGVRAWNKGVRLSAAVLVAPMS